MDIIKFTNDFVEEWNGRKLNINGAHVNFDGRYGIQCMDLWNYFWTEFGIPVKDFPRHVDAAAVWEDYGGKHYEYFDGILPSEPAKRGDIFIYNRLAWGTGYGHIGIVISDNVDSITVLEANGLGDGYEDDWMNQYGSAPRIHTWPKTNLYGYLRYINPEGLFDMYTPEERKEILKAARLINRYVDAPISAVDDKVWGYKNKEKIDAWQILRNIRDAVTPK